MSTSTPDHFALTLTNRALLNASVTIGICDAADLAELAFECRRGIPEILARIDRRAETLLHTNRDRRSSWIQLRAAVLWLAIDAEDETPDDAHGFAADARAKSRAIAAVYGIDHV